MAKNTGINQAAAGSKSHLSGKVIFDVGGRKFITLVSSLEESDFLSSLVSGRWDHNQQEDGSFFIDADPDLFQYILEYLRRKMMPLCWDREKGHDLPMYKALLQEADYYGIPRLLQWLREGSYTDAVCYTTTITQKRLLNDGKIEFARRKSIYYSVKTSFHAQSTRITSSLWIAKGPYALVPEGCRKEWY